jgi:hypothetical protein
MSDGRDVAVDRALSRRTELINELQQIDTFLEVYRKYSGSPDSDSSAKAHTVPAEKTEIPAALGGSDGMSANPEVLRSAPKGMRRSAPGMRQTEFVGFVRAMLLENGAPMSAAQIIKSFHDKGRHVGGTDESSNLKTKLWRAKELITTVPGAGYWPIDVPCDAASYKPPVTGGTH